MGVTFLPRGVFSGGHPGVPLAAGAGSFLQAIVTAGVCYPCSPCHAGFGGGLCQPPAVSRVPGVNPTPWWYPGFPHGPSKPPQAPCGPQLRWN